MAGLQFTCEASILANALRDVREAVERRNTIPICGNVLIEAGAAGWVRLTATNLDLYASRRIAAVVAEAGATTAGAYRLTDVVSALEAGAQVEITDKGTDNRMTVRSGRSNFRIASLPAADFPKLPVVEPLASFKMPLPTLLGMLATVRHAVSKEEVRYFLRGIYFHLVNDVLTFAATDGSRLARLTLPIPAGAEKLPGTIVSGDFLDLFKKAADGAEGDVFLEFTDKVVCFTIDDLVVTGKVIDGIYPDYTRVIPRESAAILRFDTDDLDGAIRRALLMADGNSSSVLLAPEKADTIIVSRSSTIAGDAKEEVPFTCEGKPKAVAFNGHYLREALTALDADEVEIAVGEAWDTPALITSPSRPAKTLVVVPMRN